MAPDPQSLKSMALADSRASKSSLDPTQIKLKGQFPARSFEHLAGAVVGLPPPRVAQTGKTKFKFFFCFFYFGGGFGVWEWFHWIRTEILCKTAVASCLQLLRRSCSCQKSYSGNVPSKNKVSLSETGEETPTNTIKFMKTRKIEWL